MPGRCDAAMNEMYNMKRNLCASLCSATHAVRLTMIVVLSAIAIGMKAQTYTGNASYYGPGFHGRKSANGTTYNMYKFTCAHKTLPFGTKLKVTNLKNGKTTVVEVTDRGPYAKGRIIDLSKVAAAQIDMVKSGVARVRIEVLKKERSENRAQLILTEPEHHDEFKSKVPVGNTTAQWSETFR